MNVDEGEAMRVRFELCGLSSFIVLGAVLTTGCGSSGSNFSDAGGGAGDSTVGDGGTGVNRGHTGPLNSGVPDSGYGADAFFANDPEPHYCVFLDGGMMPDAVGGTPTCPSDKNREGCPCPTIGESAACWPGLRVDRDIGVCKDGTTTCISTNEGTEQVWGPCMGYVLPTPGATEGAPACKCFSSGQWAISNLSPCFITYPGLGANGGNAYYAVSSYNVDGGIACPEPPNSPPPAPEPGVPWATDTIKSDCAGEFTLCYTIKAGNVKNPQPSDCVIGQSCTHGVYSTANAVEAFPPLAGWTGMSPACAAQFQTEGGYGEMSVQGESEYCQGIGADDGGAPYVFNRLPYCATICQSNPNATGCAGCQSGGSGTFGGS
jgi:hypothetical protein